MTDPRVSLTLRLPSEVWERLREQAHQERTTITALILEAIDYTHEWRDEPELHKNTDWNYRPAS